ncbi:hypothetical protein K501DRAFT_287501 [Backusella circina FSU 941]|nr:hypothetical protein K501DRAFT_287501 [Backusella circina FSU 941]
MKDYEQQYICNSNNKDTMFWCGDLDEELYHFNSDPLSSKDIFMYREDRSEHLLVRIYHHSDDSPKQNILRLSKGIFIKQQTSPPLSGQPVIEDSLNLLLMSNINDIDTLSQINTFDFNDIFNMIQEEPTHNTFIPYTYTLGARFTNPYRHHDILIRGNIPLWCQILFIHNCVLRQETEWIQPGSHLSGLLPFATEMSFTFHTCYSQEPPLPVLTLLFERFAMELSEPEFMMGDRSMVHGNTWKDKQDSILKGILYCDIPEPLATVITDMANSWAATQGIPAAI